MSSNGKREGGMFRVRFRNANDTALFVQVDPWAGLYRLLKGEAIEFAAETHNKEMLFEIDEYNDTRILTLPNCDEYFVVEGERMIHWTDFLTNMDE